MGGRPKSQTPPTLSPPPLPTPAALEVLGGARPRAAARASPDLAATQVRTIARGREPRKSSLCPSTRPAARVGLLSQAPRSLCKVWRPPGIRYWVHTSRFQRRNLPSRVKDLAPGSAHALRRGTLPPLFLLPCRNQGCKTPEQRYSNFSVQDTHLRVLKWIFLWA